MFTVMQIQTLLFLLLLFFLGLSHSERTVAEELGSHQLQRLVDLLTVHECEELFLALTNPEEKVFKQLERLSSEKNPLRPHPRTPRDIEVGKNLNQDKTLGLQRYVEEYHEQVNKMTSQFILPQSEADHHEETPDVSARQVRSLSWKDLDLVVERQLVPPYRRQFLDGAWPLLYGLIFGFVAALGVGLPVMLFTMRICLGSQTKTQH
ncbi:transmembrane and death domain protein 1-like isoform X2 [Astyanax mexicanus]|uniref:transmembrane and death domain protein 1-like isoform X2 n=1 Tax=Astyanax mexicanus TaxID=7994 RepID=UPI0020CAA084|nr:transmembrane and death domain protein 1-like isoform X2 [Astyanax mexicanus]